MRAFTGRFATTQETVDWDDHVQADPRGGDLLQAASYADVKKHHGWKPVHLVHEPQDGSQPVFTLALEKSVPGLGRLWYMPKGPSVEHGDDLVGFSRATQELVERERLGVFLVKMEPVLEDSAELTSTLEAAGLVRSFPIQSNDSTAVLDTDRSEDEVFKALHSRGRNAVRRAIREEARVERVPVTEATMKAMYGLMQTIGQGNAGVTLRPYEYYRRFWLNFDRVGQGRLYFAYEDDAPSVGAYVVAYGRHGFYKDGGSLPRRKQYGDSHLVQWTALTDLMRDHGIVDYDFVGTPPKDRLKDKEHPFHGLGMFKTSFTRSVIDYTGVWDQRLSPRRARIWDEAVEKVLRQLWVRSRSEPFY
ncbi:GNAT family N-acetyltransferase [Kocuria palustris]|uniref:lipid II:glycine glycyltransferase FemX n=1 Tax=Kocuria palustris TaxID=71999 RepID=UPI00119FB3AF|nr:GNAT family N-acetyltransferase [Kocuria palustris]